MDDDDLRAELRSAIPEPPDTSGWAEEARLRHGRRTRLAMTSAVALLVLAVVGAVLWPSLNEGGRIAVPAASPNSAGSSRPVSTTPAPSHGVGSAACRGLKQSAGRLPNTAQRLRLCRADAFTTEILYPLLTVLDGDRANAVLTMLAAQKARGSHFCTAEGGRAFWLVAETDGASPVVMNLQLSGCQEAGTSDDVRTGADAVLREFLKQVPRQRAIDGAGQPQWTPVTLCSSIGNNPRSLVPAGVDTMTMVALCRYSAKGKATSLTTLSAADARTVVTDIAAHSATGGRVPCPAPRPGTESRSWRLALSNPYGDAILVEPSCAGRFFYSTGEGPEQQWVPSDEVVKLLDRITAG